MHHVVKANSALWMYTSKKKCSGIESIRSPACSKGRKVRKSKFTFNSISSQQWSNCVKIKLIFVHWSTFKIQPALGVCSSIYKGYIRWRQLNPSNNHTCVCVCVCQLWGTSTLTYKRRKPMEQRLPEESEPVSLRGMIIKPLGVAGDGPLCSLWETNTL